MEVEDPPEPILSGKRVGALRDQLHDTTMVAQHGGILKETDFNDTVIGILNLMRMLDRKELDGFIVTRPMYYFFARSVQEDAKYKEFQAEVCMYVWKETFVKSCLILSVFKRFSKQCYLRIFF